MFIFLIGSLELFGYYPNLQDNPLLTRNMKEIIAPHLLPLDHPIKRVLDSIFAKSRAVMNKTSLTLAGFSIMSIQPKSLIVVAKHPLVPGYLFKIYLDGEQSGRDNIPGWKSLTIRCINAKKLRNIINYHHMRYFTVPEKWLYLLPLDEHPSREKHQPVVLVVKDMEIKNLHESRVAWKTVVTKDHLHELYILFKAGHGSLSLPKNIPFTKHGTFAMIDTEKPEKRRDVQRIEQFFSNDMKYYWRKLNK